MTAPIVPGLNDSEIPALLAASADAGAHSAGFVLLRLPGAVAPIFLAWLEEHRSDAKLRIENAIRSTRGGELYQSASGERMRGTGLLAEQIKLLFQTFAKRHGLDRRLPPANCDLFRPPQPKSEQKWLF